MSDLSIDLGPVSSLPRIDQYFGVWSIDAARGSALFQHAASMDLAAHVASSKTPRLESSIDMMDLTSPSDPARTQRIATVFATGTLTKAGTSIDSSSSLAQFRRDVRQVAADPSVDGILLLIDSPGGTVAGTADAAAAVAEAAAVKPVFAYVEDLAASAAYWIASQADTITANHATAMVGSIGTYLVVYDSSQAAKNAGIKAHLFTTGPLKGAGAPGTPITPEQAQHFQQMVEQTNQQFLLAIAKGRQLEAGYVETLATGATWLANEALSVGLIDQIAGLDQTVSQLQLEIERRRAAVAAVTPTHTEQTMQTEQAQPVDEVVDEEAKPIEEEKPNEAPAPVAEPATARTKSPAIQAQEETAVDYIAAFGDVGARWYLEGKTFSQCQALKIVDLEKTIAALTDDNKKLTSVVESLRGTTAARFSPERNGQHEAAGSPGLKQFIRFSGSN